MRPYARVYWRRFLIAGAAIVLGFAVIGGPCYADDDAATLNSWQASFNATWQSDSCAQEFQSWNSYWSRVHDFYFGGHGVTGWFADSQTILAHVTDPAARTTVSNDLTSLGRRIGGEWAKADGCRKVRTGSTGLQKMLDPAKPAVKDYDKRLLTAANADTGNGQSIEATIKSISQQLDELGIASP